MSVQFEIELPPLSEGEFSRADLTFYGLDHGGPSFRAHVFFDAPQATLDTPREPAHGYVGSFAVFGHGDCFGEEGHCEVRGPVTAFDRRPAHQLVPATRVLVASDAVRGLVEAGAPSVRVTVVPEVRQSALADPARADTVLVVDQVALHTYL